MSEIAAFLSEAYYAVGITVVCVGLVVWLANLQSAGKTEIETRDHADKKEIETREAAIRSLTEMLVRIERVAATDTNKLFLRIEELERTGTRSTSERVTLLNHQLLILDERHDELKQCLEDFQKALHLLELKVHSLTDLFRERSEDFNRRTTDLHRRIQVIEDHRPRSRQ